MLYPGDIYGTGGGGGNKNLTIVERLKLLKEKAIKLLVKDEEPKGKG